MHRIDTATAVAVMPVPAGAGAPGFFDKGSAGPGTPRQPTNFDQDWCNAVQEEIAGVIEGAGIALNKASQGQLFLAVLALAGRIKLTADKTFYVAPGGNDGTGDGSAGNPWLTAQHAADVVQKNYDLQGHVVTIQRLASLAYTDGVAVSGPFVGAKGPQSVVFSSSGGMGTTTVTTAGNCYKASNGAQFNVTGQKLVSGSSTFQIDYAGSIIGYQGVNFGAAAQSHIVTDFGGQALAGGDYTISGGAQSHVNLSLSAIWVCNAITVTLTGAPAFGTTFVNCQQNSTVNSAGVTWTGGATGQRYAVISNGVISCGGGANYFPGNSAGAAATGGQYV